MAGIESAFMDHSGKAFRFLEEGFDCVAVPDSLSEYRAARIWRNRTTAVTVSLELTDPGLYVMLARLVDGGIPHTPINVEAEPLLHVFDLQDLIGLRAPHEAVTYDTADLWKPDKLAELVYLDALLTRKHAADVLRGDFSVFPTLEEIVRDRAVRLRLGLGE
jgi:hypothetical protein